MTPVHTSSKVLPLFMLLCLSNIGYAACDRSDVEYYLDNGFTPDQITKICTQPHVDSAPDATRDTTGNVEPPITPSTNNAVTEPRSTQPVRNSEGTVTQKTTTRPRETRRPSLENASLQQSVDADVVEFYDDKMEFIVRKCVTHSSPAESVDTPKVHCDDVLTSVNYDGLEVLKPRRSTLNVFSSKPAVKLKGNINVSLMDASKFADALKPNERRKILKILNKQPVGIPLIDGVSVDKMREQFKALAR